jgi:hypothetical protein
LDKLPPSPDALLSAQEAKERLRELRATEAARKGARSAAARRQRLDNGVSMPSTTPIFSLSRGTEGSNPSSSSEEVSSKLGSDTAGMEASGPQRTWPAPHFYGGR